MSDTRLLYNVWHGWRSNAVYVFKLVFRVEYIVSDEKEHDQEESVTNHVCVCVVHCHLYSKLLSIKGYDTL